MNSATISSAPSAEEIIRVGRSVPITRSYTCNGDMNCQRVVNSAAPNWGIKSSVGILDLPFRPLYNNTPQTFRRHISVASPSVYCRFHMPDPNPFQCLSKTFKNSLESHIPLETHKTPSQYFILAVPRRCRSVVYYDYDLLLVRPGVHLPGNSCLAFLFLLFYT